MNPATSDGMAPPSSVARGSAGFERATSVDRKWPPGLSVRPCRRRDAAELLALFADDDYQLSGTLLARFGSPDAVASWLDRHRSGNFQIVATHGGAVVGFAGLYPLPARQSHAAFVSLGVRKAFQGRGYGRALLQVILATADRLAGLSRVQLNVLVDNERAIALYRSCGFVIEGHHALFARIDTGWVNALTMARVTR